MTNRGRVARRISLPRTHLPHTRHILDDPTALQSPSLSRDSPFTSLAQWLTISHKTASRDSQKRENKLPPSAVTAMHWRRQSSLRIRGRGDRAAARNNCTLKKKHSSNTGNIMSKSTARPSHRSRSLLTSQVGLSPPVRMRRLSVGQLATRCRAVGRRVVGTVQV